MLTVFLIACERAHLFGDFARDNLGGESRHLICESASEASRRKEWGAQMAAFAAKIAAQSPQTSEPARRLFS